MYIYVSDLQSHTCMTTGYKHFSDELQRASVKSFLAFLALMFFLWSQQYFFLCKMSGTFPLQMSQSTIELIGREGKNF